jgi:hypothetical protein
MIISLYIIGGSLIVLFFLVVCADRLMDELFDFEPSIDDRLAEADMEVATRLRVGDGGERVGFTTIQKQ